MRPDPDPEISPKERRKSGPDLAKVVSTRPVPTSRTPALAVNRWDWRIIRDPTNIPWQIGKMFARESLQFYCWHLLMIFIRRRCRLKVHVKVWLPKRLTESP